MRRKKFPSNEAEIIDKLLSRLKSFRREANSKSHKILEYVDKMEELDNFKIPEIIELEIKLIEKIRGLSAPIQES